MYTMIGTANLKDIDPQAWLADVLAKTATSHRPDFTNSCVELENRNRSATRGRLIVFLGEEAIVSLL
jgi:hypothetical protein